MNELPYGVDTIVLRMTWDNPPRRVRARGRWDIARGVSPWYEVRAQPLTDGLDAGAMPIADKRWPPDPPLAMPPALSSQRPLYDPDARPPTISPLPLGGTNENPFLPGGFGARGSPGQGRALAPALPAARPSVPLAEPDPATPMQRLRLRRELERSGQMKPGDGNEAHHMVPQGGSGMTGQRDPALAQRMMRRFGMDLGDAENGLALSSRFHRRIHTEAYYEYLRKEFSLIDTREGAVRWLSRFRRQLHDADLEFQRSGELAPWLKEIAP